MSKYDNVFDNYYKHSRFIFEGVLYAMFKFVPTEGFKSQPLAFTRNEVGYDRDYGFIIN